MICFYVDELLTGFSLHGELTLVELSAGYLFIVELSTGDLFAAKLSTR